LPGQRPRAGSRPRSCVGGATYGTSACRGRIVQDSIGRLGSSQPVGAAFASRPVPSRGAALSLFASQCGSAAHSRIAQSERPAAATASPSVISPVEMLPHSAITRPASARQKAASNRMANVSRVGATRLLAFPPDLGTPVRLPYSTWNLELRPAAILDRVHDVRVTARAPGCPAPPARSPKTRDPPPAGPGYPAPGAPQRALRRNGGTAEARRRAACRAHRAQPCALCRRWQRSCTRRPAARGRGARLYASEAQGAVAAQGAYKGCAGFPSLTH
jgi:hypothetical protein